MVRDYEPTLYREQAIAHASMADLFDLPVIMTTSADTGRLLYRIFVHDRKQQSDIEEHG